MSAHTAYAVPVGADGAGSRRLRILVIGALPPPYYGGSVVTQMLLESRLSEQYELLHLDITDRRGVENIGRLDAGNVRLALTHGTRFLRMLGELRPDAVYMAVAQNTLGFLRDALFLAPSILRGTPLILHFHSGSYAAFYHGARLPLRATVRGLLRRAQRAIVLGDALAPMLDGIVPGDRVVVVPNGVPDAGMPERAGSRAGALHVLFLGNLIAGKGYVELIDAAEMLMRDGIDIRVTLAGGTVDAGALQDRLARSSLRERLRYTGAVDAAGRTAVLAEADVLALPTYYENEAHPLVILEAMSAGLPVVSTRHAAIPEMVVDGVTGMLVEPRETAALTDALRTLAHDLDLREAMGKAARRRYEERFTVDQWTARMSEVFDAVEVRRA